MRGGTPSGEELAALSTAATALLASAGRAHPDPRPAAYHSLWRRAGMRDNADVSDGAWDGRRAWGGTG